MKKYLVSVIIGLSVFTQSVWANDDQLQTQLEEMGAKNIQISDSVLPNFKSVISDQGVIQISNDGRFIIQGSILEFKNDKVTDITYKPLMPELENLKNEMITFPAKNQKYVVSVFTDISCGYCRLLHSEMKEYNDLGITIRYLAFPRAGLKSQTARQMEAIWIAKDKNYVLTQAKNGKLPQTLATPKMIKKQYDLGVKFGIRGTPAMITSKGEIIAGYVAPKKLLKMLQE
ncbi:bifunctional protein-disulfide isomerase/oxidoreductase DsbC [Pasteurella skyensis]|uniref:Thiol:disulfide interchange protein n=1 Tax=Phocoenobacter skyensis TaxID=97481 RepID=A0AAJ6NEC1_9PAST|nr:bifunctional protein-disulfide isomerase/oxidoreductase DsbC [Pasteurella skyensis]MDP8170889.1 bifunctional protein-disulfide isomerase/oxidoreductase DsbC [Pasteurella skyensis]MDP8175261.1 bifunctional protein-disulfide isomerase/oxidoreductase DsbC [Pasteurella skyensis]